MASTFFKNWFNTPKHSNAKTKEAVSTKEIEDPPPLPPERRLSISKSGKMKRKSYNKQISVKDSSLFADPIAEKCASVRNSEQVDSIDDIIEDMLKTVENTKS